MKISLWKQNLCENYYVFIQLFCDLTSAVCVALGLYSQGFFKPDFFPEFFKKILRVSF